MRKDCGCLIRVEKKDVHILEKHTNIFWDNVNKIECFAFFDCEDLKSIDLPNRIISIDRFAFALCSNLDSIYIPDSVKFIGQDVFYACDKLTVNFQNGASCKGYMFDVLNCQFRYDLDKTKGFLLKYDKKLEKFDKYLNNSINKFQEEATYRFKMEVFKEYLDSFLPIEEEEKVL